LFSINLEMFETNSLARLRIQGWMAENARFLADGKLVICAIPKAVETELGAEEDDMENISGFPRTIAGVKMAATLRESSEDGVKMSVRAVPGYDAAAVCARFGGGGHKGAAGASIALPLDEAAKEVEKAMLELE
jgi:phosphoesterase RecJ-like protein